MKYHERMIVVCAAVVSVATLFLSINIPCKIFTLLLFNGLYYTLYKALK